MRGTSRRDFAIALPLAGATALAGCAAAAPTAALGPEGDPESARVLATVASIPLAVDLARYDLAEAAFAPVVVVDYSSLWGGEAQTLTPAALMAAWRGLVPGFDATRHELSDPRARVEGDSATATAFVDGRHWVDEKLWRPVGMYRWTLAKMNGHWRVTRMIFELREEFGDRGLVAIATERAAKR